MSIFLRTKLAKTILFTWAEHRINTQSISGLHLVSFVLIIDTHIVNFLSTFAILKQMEAGNDNLHNTKERVHIRKELKANETRNPAIKLA